MFAVSEDPSTLRHDERLRALPVGRIEAEIAELAAHIAAATCRWLELVAEFERREGHVAWGFHCCAQWLAWRCSVAPRSAREKLRVARRLEELPLVRASFRRGELTYSKVRAITRVASPEVEAELVELARHATAAQVERLAGAYRRAVTVDEAEELHRRHRLSYTWEADGSLSLRGTLAPEEGALLLRALDAGRDELRERAPAPGPSGGGSAGPPTDAEGAPAAVDALVLMANTLLSHGATHRPAGERHQVVVHVDDDALSRDSERGRCELDDGPAICPETARRLSCDGSVVRMRESAGRALDIGRRARAVPPAMRRALRARDGGCRFPGCTNRRWVDAHHIRHWARGGDTALDNLVELCGRHHRLLHEGGFGLERRRDGTLVFRRPDGQPIPTAPAAPSGSSGRLRAANRQVGLAIGVESCVPLSAGAPMSLDLAVGGLAERARAP